MNESVRRLRGRLAGDGRPGPIEERIGRRLVRLVDPESDEGRKLLGEGAVELVGPEGDSLGSLELSEAYRRLRIRLERHLADEDSVTRRSGLEESLSRLDRWSRKMVRARESTT